MKVSKSGIGLPYLSLKLLQQIIDIREAKLIPEDCDPLLAKFDPSDPSALLTIIKETFCNSDKLCHSFLVSELGKRYCAGEMLTQHVFRCLIRAKKKDQVRAIMITHISIAFKCEILGVDLKDVTLFYQLLFSHVSGMLRLIMINVIYQVLNRIQVKP
jgi:hypothetical protein